MKPTLTLRNAAQVVLFKKELAGQISDGYWENSRPYGHWRWSSGLEVVEGVDIGFNREAWRPARKYNFANKELVDIVGERMIGYVRESDPINYGAYTLKHLKRDLRDISDIVNRRAR